MVLFCLTTESKHLLLLRYRIYDRYERYLNSAKKVDSLAFSIKVLDQFPRLSNLPLDSENSLGVVKLDKQRN